MERRYGWLFPVVLVMAFTRPSGLAFALAVGIHVVYRWLKRGEEPFPVRERVLSASLAVFSGLAGLAWPAIALLTDRKRKRPIVNAPDIDTVPDPTPAASTAVASY